MTILLSQSDLTKGGLKLFLSNDLGQSQDAASVRWTVFSMITGNRVSGERIDAIKQDTGCYYATFYSDVSPGSYQVLWEIESDNISEPQRVYQPFYIIDPSSCERHEHLIIKKNPPAIGSLVFLPYSFLGPDDLFINIKDENGFLQDAYSITWHIQNEVGRALTLKTFAIHIATGSYYAPFIVSLRNGNYKIIWEFQADVNAPLQSASQQFSVLGCKSPFRIVCGSVCGSKFIIAGYNPYCKFYIPYKQTCMSIPKCISKCSHGGRNSRSYMNSCSHQPCVPVMPAFQAASCCCDYEASRQVHIATSVLPNAGAFTHQGPFLVPTRIRKVTFYITYARGAPGGHAVFHLLWGNGVEETQETVRDLDIIPEDSSRIAQNLFIQDLLGPTPVDDHPISYVLSVTVPGGVTTVRLVAAEGGVPNSPGTIGITLTAST